MNERDQSVDDSMLPTGPGTVRTAFSCSSPGVEDNVGSVL